MGLRAGAAAPSQYLGYIPWNPGMELVQRRHARKLGLSSNRDFEERLADRRNEIGQGWTRYVRPRPMLFRKSLRLANSKRVDLKELH